MSRIRRTLPFSSAVAGLFVGASASIAHASPVVSVSPTTSPAVAPVTLPPGVAGVIADQQLFTWTGTVDREVFVVMRGRQVTTRGVDARLPNSARVNGAVPRGNGDVRVRLENGRGSVDVIEQPSARNGYQTVVRIRDPLGGTDRYRLTAYWTGDDRGPGSNDRGNNGRGNGRDDDGRWEDRDDRDDRRRGNARGRDDDRRRDRDDDRRRDDRGRNDRGDGRWDDRNRGNNGGGALGPGTLRWSGRVDDVVEISIQGRRVDYRTRSGAQVTSVRSNVSGGGLPQRDGRVTIVNGNGRGTVQVVQQPSRLNGYAAVIRIQDPRGGAADYDLQARW